MGMAGTSMAWTLLLFYVAGSARHSIPKQSPEACQVEGPNGEFATFPVRDCLEECVNDGNWEGFGGGGNMQTTEVFSKAFTASLNEDTCICSFGGKDMVRFRSFSAEERLQCRNDDPLAKKRCWEAYMKGHSMELTKQIGAGGKPVLVSQFHLEEYRQAKFFKRCAFCYEGNEDECNSGVSLPPIFYTLSEDIVDMLNDLDAGLVVGGDIEVILEMLTEDQKEELLRKE